ncbi:hypothetical protein [Janthinobacterium sp. AD80]|uniref:hypothetical protein n=1 Tax=unclassified Janthinobacterium TaxID=2610881 RepID=UPI0015E0B515|nr:hypothetical protein [Janthinobacterium sp. AD80]
MLANKRDIPPPEFSDFMVLAGIKKTRARTWPATVRAMDILSTEYPGVRAKTMNGKNGILKCK